MELWHIYSAIGGAGAIAVVCFAVAGELDSDHDGFGLLSPLAIAAGLTLGGGSGAVLALTPLIALSLPISLAVGIVSFLIVVAAKRQFKKQESNSQIGVNSYLNSEAKVLSSCILVDDWGVIGFTDSNGSYVERRATNSHGASLSRGDRVVIHSIENGQLYIAPWSS